MADTIDTPTTMSSSTGSSGALTTQASLSDISSNEYEANRDTKFGLLSEEESYTDLNKQYDELIGKMGAVSSSMLSGEIPKDVQEQIKIMTAENSLAGGQGMGSQASKFMTARDLGLTSLDIQEKGMASAATTASLIDARTQFQKSYALSVEQFMQDVRSVDLSVAQQQEAARQFNEATKLAATELASQTMLAYHEMSMNYSLDADYSQPVESAASDVSAIMETLKATYGI